MVQGDHYFPFPKRKIMTEQVHNDDARPNGFIRAGYEKQMPVTLSERRSAGRAKKSIMVYHG